MNPGREIKHPSPPECLYLWSSLSACVASAVIALIAFFARTALKDQALLALFTSVALAWHLVAMPTVLRGMIFHRWQKAPPNMGLLILAVVFTSLLAGWFCSTAGRWIFVATGTAAFLWVIVILVRQHPLWAASAIIGGAITGVALAGVIWNGDYLSPTFSEGLKYGGGHLVIDPLFHSAVANMWNTHGVSSAGFDGISYLPYHSGSHWAMAAISRFVNADILYSYNLCFPVLFTPVFVFSVQCCGISIASGPSFCRSYKDLLLLFVVPISTIAGVIPNAISRQVGLWKSFLSSESMCLGMILFLCGIAFLIDLVRATSSTASRGKAFIASALAIPVLTGVMTFTKISVGCAFAAVAAYIITFWLTPRLGIYRTVVSLFLTVCAFYAVYQVTRYPMTGDGFHFLHFLRAKVSYEYRPWFYHFLLAWSILAMFLWGRLQRLEKSRQLQKKWGIVRSVEIDCLILVVVVSLIPGSVMAIAGGSAMYFFDIQRHVACALIISAGIRIREATFATDKSECVYPSGTRSGSILLFSAIVSLLIPTMTLNTLNDFRAFADSVAANYGWHERGLKTVIVKLSGELPAVHHPHAVLRGDLIVLLRSLGEMSLSRKRETIIFVPKSNRIYWDFFEGRKRKAVPFLVPAITGIAMIDGLPNRSADVPRWNGYGFDLVELPNDREDGSFDSTPISEIRHEAAMMGFSHLVVVAVEDGKCVLEEHLL